MNLNHPVSTRKLHRKRTLHNRPKDDRRVGVKRVPVYGHATYIYKKGPFIYTTGGVIRDLSGPGCSIQTTMPHIEGARISLLLSLDGEQKPLYIRGAIVARVSRNSLGIAFPKLKPPEYYRLLKPIRRIGQLDLPIS